MSKKVEVVDLGEEFDLDGDLEVEGVWQTVTGEGKVLIAAWENPNFISAFREMPRGIRRRSRAGRLTNEEDRALMAELVAKTVLLDWVNMGDDGKPLGDYTAESGKKQLLKHPKFYDFVGECAQDEKLYLKSSREETSGNLLKPSNGT